MSRPAAGAAYEAARIRFELGEAVRLRREQLGLTQAQLAECTELKQPAVARFEAGETIPTIPCWSAWPKPWRCGSTSSSNRCAMLADHSRKQCGSQYLLPHCVASCKIEGGSRNGQILRADDCNGTRVVSLELSRTRPIGRPTMGICR
ncbi:helix-turn-helix domain-containing protein [[Actinomadura] parvosata]|uniref:helix-turn-helix domain-containing protein n=1 Tax=[Actinomadura] parvosata TaxID=1955412 RepID=UPI00406C5B6A